MLRYQDFTVHVHELIQAGLAAANPKFAVSRFLRRDGHLLHIGEITFDLAQGHVYIVSVGKAAAPMAEAAIKILEDQLFAGVVIAKKDSQTTGDLIQLNHPELKILEGNHPIPGNDSLQATAAVKEMLASTSSEDLVICLISGGTSALLTDPIISIDEWQRLTNILLTSGCRIDEFNAVRRQLDRIKGGGLVHVAAPARCVSLILSDVVGNPLQAIGSGPTVISPVNSEETVAILNRYHVQQRLDPQTWRNMQEALQNISNQPKNHFLRSEHIIVGDVRQAAMAVLTRAMQLGFVAQILTARLEGEAREVGKVVAAIAKEMPPGRCLILGGETTVTMRGDGMGGRNQELALAAAIALDGWSNIVVVTLATDGEDGPTPAAGAVITGETVQAAVALDLDPHKFLSNNDSFHFFESLSANGQLNQTDENQVVKPGLLVTGSTGTNVNDLVIIITYPDETEVATA